MFGGIERSASVWALFNTSAEDPPDLLARAAYPAPVDSNEGGRALRIDYGLNRPGVDGSASEYVHLAANPFWGDLWI